MLFLFFFVALLCGRRLDRLTVTVFFFFLLEQCLEITAAFNGLDALCASIEPINSARIAVVEFYRALCARIAALESDQRGLREERRGGSGGAKMAKYTDNSIE